MSDFVFNIAKGRVVELYNRVDTNSPSGCEFVVMAVNRGSATDATMKDYATFATLLGDPQVAEVTNTGYARKILVAADLATATVDNAGDRFDLDLPDLVWTSVASGTGWTDLVTGYDASGAGTDSGIVPLTCHSFVVTPLGSNVNATISTAGFFRAA